jgi:putative membrane protein
MEAARDRGNAAELRILLLSTLAALIVTGIAPYDRLTWAMEVSWVVVGVPLLVATRSRFPLTPLLYRLLFVHALILILGGYYTYARVPLGFWFGDLFGLTRNYYDRLGHLAQGFIPAILAREILVRRSPLAGSRWLPVVVVAICLAFSAFFEMIEWWSALALGADATDYLATQGDPWDTQADMFCALIGAVAALVLLSRVHDQQLRRLSGTGNGADNAS